MIETSFENIFFNLKMAILTGEKLEDICVSKADIILSDLPKDHSMRDNFPFNIFYKRLEEFNPEALKKIKLYQILPVIFIIDRPALSVILANEISKNIDNIENIIKDIFIENALYEDFLNSYEKIWDKQKITDMDTRKKYNTDNLLDTPLGWLF